MNNKIKGGIFVFLGACSFGVLSTIVKTAYAQGYTLGQITGSQTLFGVILLWGMYYLQRNLTKREANKNRNIQEKKTAWWKVCLSGTFTGLVGIFYYQSVKILPASIAIILLMQYLWITIVIEAIVFRKRPTKMQIIAVFIVLIGTVFAAGIFNNSLSLNPKGIAFGLLAAFSYAIFVISSGRVGNELPPMKKSALMITGSCFMTFVIFPPLFLFDGTFVQGLYKWGLALAALGTVIPPLFFSYGMPKTGVSLGAILSAAELPVAVTSSHFILKEDVAVLQWMGVALILFAIILPNLRFLFKRRNTLFP